MDWLLLAVPIAALIALFGPSRYENWRPRGGVAAGPPGGGDGPDAVGVREPRRPAPRSDAGAIALDPPEHGNW